MSRSGLSERQHLAEVLAEDFVNFPLKRWSTGGKQGVDLLLGFSRTEIAPAIEQVYFVTFADHACAIHWPGSEFEAAKAADQAHAVFGRGFVADASAFATFALLARAGLARCGLIETEQGVAQIIFSGQGAQNIRCLLAGLE